MAHNSELRISTSTQELAFDPTKGLGYQQYLIMRLYFDTLVKVNSSGALMPAIADSWTILDGGKTYQFHINTTAKFHNLKSITANDVATSLARHLAPGVRSPMRSHLELILADVSYEPAQKRIAAIYPLNDETLIIKLKSPYSQFIATLASPILSIVPSDFDENKPIGSGPYIIQSADKNSTTLMPFEGYYGGKRNFDKISVSIIKDLTEIQSAFNSGKIDLAIGAPVEFLIPRNMPQAADLKSSNSLVTTDIFLNLDKDIFSTEKSRDAFKKLVNYFKSQYKHNLNIEKPLNNIIPFGVMPVSYYETTMDQISPQEFKKINKIDDKEIEIIFPKNLFLKEYILQFEQTMIEAGFRPRISEVKGKELMEPLFNKKFDIIILPYLGSLPDPDGFLEILSPTGILKNLNLGTGILFDELTKFRNIQDNEERLSKYEGALKKFESKSTIIPLIQQNLPFIYRKGLSVPDTNFGFHLDLGEIFWQ